MTFFGLGFLALVYLFLIAWIAKVAEARGRMIVPWALIGAAAGGVAFSAGSRLMNATDEFATSSGVTLLATFAAPVAMVVAMCAVALALLAIPIKVSSRSDWPVTRMAKNQEAGRLVIGKDEIRLELPSGTTTIATGRLRAIVADGECVRIRWDEHDESMLMPRGKPDTPAGRKQQSRSLERRLRATLRR